MVGKDAQLEVVIDKALMQSAQYRLKADVIAPVLKDVVQALNLLGAVGEDEYFIVLGQELRERLADEVKILVVNTLRLAMQRQTLHTLLGCRLAASEGDAAQCVQSSHEQVGINNLVGRLGVALVSDQSAYRHSLPGNLANACIEPLLTAAQHDGVIVHIIEQRHIVLPATTMRIVVENAHAVETLLAQLGLDIKGAYRVDIVTPKIDAVRQFITEREHIQDGAAHTELARFIDIIGRREPQFTQVCNGLAQVGHAARRQLDGAGLNVLATTHTFGKRLGIGDHPAHLGIVKPAVEHLGTQNLVWSIHLAVLDVPLIARWEDQHLLVASQLAQIIIHVAGLVQIIDHDKVRASTLG